MGKERELQNYHFFDIHGIIILHLKVNRWQI